MFFRAGGVVRVDGVEREYPLATPNYSNYPAYSKFLGLNEFNRANGLNGIAVTTRHNKSI